MIKFIFFYLVMNIFFSIEKKIENYVRIEKNDKIVLFKETKSLKHFKYFIKTLCIVSSLEFSILNSNWCIIRVIIGIILSLFGIMARTVAIKKLKEYWSFNVKIFKDHYKVDTGIYRYVKHPAYWGNVYIIGFLIIFGLYFSSVISAIFLLYFNLLRINIENSFLANVNMKDNTYKPPEVKE